VSVATKCPCWLQRDCRAVCSETGASVKYRQSWSALTGRSYRDGRIETASSHHAERTNGRTDRRTYRTIVVGRASSPRRQGPSRQTSARRPSLIDPATAATSPARSLGRHRVNVPRRGAIETDAGGRAGLLNCTRRDRTFVPPSPGHLGPDLQNILRQSYDYLTIMRKLRSICDGRLIYQTVLRMEKGFS